MAFLTTCHEDDSLGGGRHRALISIKPRAFRNGAMGGGALERIVHAWEQGDIARPHVINRAGMPLRMDGDGFLDIYPTREPDRYLSIGAPYILQGGVWTKVNLGPATRTANRISWTTAQADISVTFGGHFVEVGRIELKGGWVPPNRQVAIPVGLTGLTRSGGVLLRDGVPVMHMRAPVMLDAANPLDVRPISHDFVQVAGQWYLVLTLPSLTGMGRPVIDPILVLQPDAAAGKDTWLQSDSPTTNHGTVITLTVRRVNSPDPDNKYNALIQWNLSAISGTAIITAVAQSLTWTVASVDSALNFFRLLPGNDWVELEATYNVRQTAIAWLGSAGCQTSGTDFDSIAMLTSDFTTTVATVAYPFNADGIADVQSWVNGSASNCGLIIRRVTGINYVGMHECASSDHATPAYRPQLTVDYTLPTGRGLKGLLNRSIL